MSDDEKDVELQLSHLSDREILILALRELKGLRNLNPRVRSLETWRTGLTAAWGALAGGGILAFKLFNISPRSHAP